jgi:Rieske Fe-S protein
LSESQEDTRNKESDQEKTGQFRSKPETTAQPTQTATPRVGTPIGQVESPCPSIGTPIVVHSTSSDQAATPRQMVGAQVGTQGPTDGAPRTAIRAPAGGTSPPTPAVARPAPPRPTISIATKPATARKTPESKAEISRRNFIKGLVVLGGIVAVGQFVTFGHYLQGSVGQSSITSQVLQDSTTGATLKTTNATLSKPNSWTTFVYPRTGNPNIDADTFRQCVLIHLPKGWTAPTNLSAKDPISGDTFIALSRVCVHLWCLWSYVPSDDRGICPCHGSQYVPGGVPGSQGALNPGLAVAGPASLQTAPNNQLPVITINIATDGVISATGVVGQIGCGQKC